MISEFTLTLTVQEMDYLGSCLVEKPFKEVSGLIAKINNQLASQQNPVPAPITPPMLTPLEAM